MEAFCAVKGRKGVVVDRETMVMRNEERKTEEKRVNISGVVVL